MIWLISATSDEPSHGRLPASSSYMTTPRAKTSTRRSSGSPRLVEEHVDELLVAREVRQDALQADQLLEARRAGLLGEVHLGHAAGGDELDELVLADRGRHVGVSRCVGGGRW